jgi:hypothetical protein
MTRIHTLIRLIDRHTLWAFNAQPPLGGRR